MVILSQISGLTCPGNLDHTTGCLQCIPHWIDVNSNCTICQLNWNKTSNCNTCLSGWNISTDCKLCDGNYDEKTNCLSCHNGWYGDECEKNAGVFYINTFCALMFIVSFVIFSKFVIFVTIFYCHYSLKKRRKPKIREIGNDGFDTGTFGYTEVQINSDQTRSHSKSELFVLGDY